MELVHVTVLQKAAPGMQETRLFFSWTFFRVTTPYREVTFADFLLADVLTSLAKALSDSERALCHLALGPVMQPASTDQALPRTVLLAHVMLSPCRIP